MKLVGAQDLSGKAERLELHAGDFINMTIQPMIQTLACDLA